MACATASLAATGVLTGQEPIEFRAGAGNEFNLITRVKKGQQVSIIEPGTQWTKITTAEGITGWVRNSNLQTEAATAPNMANVNVPQLMQRNNELELKLSELEKIKQEQAQIVASLMAEVEALRSDKGLPPPNITLPATDTALRAEIDNLKSIAANALNTEKSNQKLREENELIGVELERLRADNADLRSDRFNKGLQSGAAAVLLGILIAILVPKISGS
ncbi:MAG TPA: TIGR04211 family SH3 domain-containing protein, partial [Pseudomonadales bacterium]|nr:TIGR04211 family SH3 domain-containing protein [Pseudomonadales bacterium]